VSSSLQASDLRNYRLTTCKSLISSSDMHRMEAPAILGLHFLPLKPLLCQAKIKVEMHTGQKKILLLGTCPHTVFLVLTAC
jgi:hypothetical protein